MLIEKEKKMLLFRFNNYKKTSFILEHKNVLNENGYVWMLKIGKKSSAEKLHEILKAGGWIILRAPKADGSKSFIARFSEMRDSIPSDEVFPDYYDTLLYGEDSFEYDLSSEQWFKLTYLEEIDSSVASHLLLEKNRKKVDDVIGTTRTAVMFITSEEDINL